MFRILESQTEEQSLDIKRYVAYRNKEKWLEESAAWNIEMFIFVLCISVILGKLTVV
jgi:hypothetical protein